MSDRLAIAIVVAEGLAKGYVYVFEQFLGLRLDLCLAIAWPSARLAIASFYVYSLIWISLDAILNLTCQPNLEEHINPAPAAAGSPSQAEHWNLAMGPKRYTGKNV